MIDQELNIARHSAAHIMAAAVQKLWPDAKFDIGPVSTMISTWSTALQLKTSKKSKA